MREPVPAPGSEGAGGHGRPLCYLVVNDNVDAAESLAMLLTLYGHEVRAAHDGPAALQVSAAWEPEVVFLDIGLPKGMSGYDVARRFGRRSGWRGPGWWP